MDAKDFAEGLRQIADWYEANPDVACPAGQLDVYDEPENKARVADLLRRLGNPIKKEALGDDLFTFTRMFNGIALRFVFYRSTVCTSRVVGTRTIPAESAREATPERVVDVIEWDCGALLSESEATVS